MRRTGIPAGTDERTSEQWSGGAAIVGNGLLISRKDNSRDAAHGVSLIPPGHADCSAVFEGP
jgi:hypothetical protein